MKTSLPSIAVYAHHNASVAIYKDEEIVTIIEFERLLNLKNASFLFFEPIYARDFILKEISNYLKNKFGYTKYYKVILSFGYTKIPQYYKDLFPAEIYEIDNGHLRAHAYSSLYQSPLKEALIISFDGGSWEGHFNIYKATKGKDLEFLKIINIDLGCHYQIFGSFCEEIKNYHVLTAAGKILGLQSYGEIKQEWIKPIKDFMSYPPPYWGRLEERVKQLSKEIKVDLSPKNKISGKISFDLLRTVQEAFEQIFFEQTKEIVDNYNLPIILTGGCALNINLNTKARQVFNKDIFIAPNSNDCGLAVGLLCNSFRPKNPIDVTYKGLEILDRNCLMEYVNSRKGILADLNIIAEDLSKNLIVGIVNGNAEHGPRALGNRSIVCSPIPKDMKDILNQKVKGREWYRPFAPVVRLEDASEYFEMTEESRWMNFAIKVKDKYKDLLPSITHVDGTARVQTVTKEQNKFIYELLTAFKAKTGIGVLINTSFNVNGKPILSTYRDAFKILDETKLDRLYLDGFYFKKGI